MSATDRPRLVYLHGFRSSPKSFKAQMIGARLNAIGRGADFICPQLPASPREAIALVRDRIAPSAQDTLVGSSLGGFYATVLAEHLGCRAVLLNPATEPARGLAAYVGVQTMFHSDEPFEFLPEYVDELRALSFGAITFPERYLLVAAKGDELLDWREMVQRYTGARHLVLEGSDHGISDFDQIIDAVLSFAVFGSH